ncbi:MAG: hypothetical protein ACJ74T_16825 [Pyrinomonadaceae bacterium]
MEIDEKAQIPAKLKGAVFAGVRFKVEKAWKGISGDEVTILSDLGLLACIQRSDKFRVGESYLIYAYGKDLFDVGCSRSVPTADATDDIRRLNSAWFRLSARLYPYPKI